MLATPTIVFLQIRNSTRRGGLRLLSVPSLLNFEFSIFTETPELPASAVQSSTAIYMTSPFGRLLTHSS
jgi:hypothetical protein